MPFRAVPILLYHKIETSSAEEDPFRLNVSPRDFERQMAYLYESGYRCISLEDLMRYGRDRPGRPKRSFAITFDDGYQDNFTIAYPILQRYGFTATIFMITDFVGRSLRWPGKQPSQFLSWTEIEEMGRDGISFGSHTHTHPILTQIPDEQAVEEICRSKEVLEKRLGRAVSFFAYPGGHQNERLQQMVRERGYQGACGVDIGPASPFNLWRIQVHTNDSLTLLRLKVSGWFEWLKRLRQRTKTLWWLTEMAGRSLNRVRGHCLCL